MAKQPYAKKSGSVKNPEQEAENPGGRPTEKVAGSSPGPRRDPAGQQGQSGIGKPGVK